jgi:hypothetical protein
MGSVEPHFVGAVVVFQLGLAARGEHHCRRVGDRGRQGPSLRCGPCGTALRVALDGPLCWRSSGWLRFAGGVVLCVGVGERGSKEAVGSLFG